MTRQASALLTAGFVLLGAASCSAQEDAAKFPSEQHAKLNALIGSWDVATKYKVGPGKEIEGKATCEAKWIVGGNAVQQEYRSSFGGRPFTVVQLIGYDVHKKKFFEIKLDSMDTGAMFNEGTISADGKVITQVGERIDPATGKAGKLRTVTTFVDPDHFTLEWYMPNEDGKEERAVLLSLARKKS